LLETIIVDNLPQKSREEIAAMFELSDLKKTRFYQDIFEEVQAEAQAVAKQREKVSILRMVSLGLSTEQIATFLDLPVAEVEATIAQSEQN
jgi:predicted transposase YdaD